MQILLKQPTFKINNEAQLTNAFIKLVQAGVRPQIDVTIA